MKIHPEGGGSKILRNVDILLHYYVTSQPARPRFEQVSLDSTFGLPTTKKPVENNTYWLLFRMVNSDIEKV
jgi:hypothetical protein